ncbi:hypothetical protein GQX73_g4785 [Xylaria multiplex]|uniref:Transcription factor domain-containing protein n=1 Tax=Xylaria multiplex TaxID=323545 RepID=A0A7C8MRT0_9PEZI|nr:hypothetical protein GQX73_g4785 [Xylaria multiplex]
MDHYHHVTVGNVSRSGCVDNGWGPWSFKGVFDLQETQEGVRQKAANLLPVLWRRARGTAAKAVPIVYRKGQKQTLHRVTNITLPNELAQTAYVENYISIFLGKYLPANCWRSPCDWVEIAYALHTSDKLIQLGLLSLGLFAVGESQRAIQSYCCALQKLQTVLSIPTEVQNDSILVACKLFSLVEIFHGADENALSQGFKWQSHLSGMLAIIQSRKPHLYQSGFGHQLFTDGRYSLVISAIGNRQRAPLNTPEWRTIPWEKEPKSSMDKLYDMMADLSVILADTDEMRCCNHPAQKANMHEKLLRACQCLDQSLKGWLKETGPLTNFYDNHGIYSNPTDNSGLPLAHMTLLYWTVCVILYSTLISIYDPPLFEIPAKINPRPYLRSVADALPFFWESRAGLRGANLASWPWGVCLHVAYATPHRYPEEIALLEQFVTQQNLAGTVLSFLQSLQRDSGTPEMVSLDGREGCK